MIAFSGLSKRISVSNLEINETNSKSVSKKWESRKKSRREGRERIEGGKERKRGNARKVGETL